MQKPETPEEIAELILRRVRSGAIDSIAIAATGPSEKPEFYVTGINETKKLMRIIAAVRFLDNIIIHQTRIGNLPSEIKPVNSEPK